MLGADQRMPAATDPKRSFGAYLKTTARLLSSLEVVIEPFFAYKVTRVLASLVDLRLGRFQKWGWLGIAHGWPVSGHAGIELLEIQTMPTGRRKCRVKCKTLMLW